MIYAMQLFILLNQTTSGEIDCSYVAISTIFMTRFIFHRKVLDGCPRNFIFYTQHIFSEFQSKESKFSPVLTFICRTIGKQIRYQLFYQDNCISIVKDIFLLPQLLRMIQYSLPSSS